MVEHKIDLFRFKWELDKFKEKEIKENATLFYGSSTFAIWKDIEERFKDYNALNFGFGGSTSDEALYHYEEYAKPVHAKVLVWYNGDNEPVCGYTFEETKELYLATWDKFLKDNPDTKIIVLGTKVSPARIEYKDYVLKLNAWVKEYAQTKDYITYINTLDLCYDEKEFHLDNYLADQLHFSPKAYVTIAERIEEVLKKYYK